MLLFVFIYPTGRIRVCKIRFVSTGEKRVKPCLVSLRETWKVEILNVTFAHRIGGNRELSRESSNKDRLALKQRFRLQIGNLKQQFAIGNAILTVFGPH